MNRDPFTAIADPTRREIIGLLSTESMSINQISDQFDAMSRQAVTKQLLYLQDCGLVTMERRGREKYCYLTLDNLEEVNRWLKQYERFWNKKLDRLGEYLLKKNERLDT